MIESSLSDTLKVKKINLTKLLRMRQDSFLNVKSSHKKLQRNIRQYNILYVALGLMAMLTALMNYPFQKYLEKNGYSENDINSLRFISFFPWLIKPVFGLLGDYIFPFKLKYRGWILVVSFIGISFLAVSLFLKDDSTFVIITTTVVISCLVHLDTLAQGLTTIAVYFDKRRYKIETETLVLDSEQTSTQDNSSPYSERKTGSRYIPTYTFYFGIYTVFNTLGKAVFSSTAFLTAGQNDQYYTIRLVVMIAFILMIPMAFVHEELSQVGWAQNKEGFMRNTKVMAQNSKALLGKDSWPSVVGILFVIATIVGNPLNYFNETVIYRLITDMKVCTSTQASIALIIGGIIASSIYTCIAIRFASTSIDFYALSCMCLMIANCMSAIIFANQYFCDSAVFRYFVLFLSQFTQLFIPNTCRIALVDLIMRRLPASSVNGSLTFIAILTLFVNISQTLSKEIDRRLIDHSNYLSYVYCLIAIAFPLLGYIIVRRSLTDNIKFSSEDPCY